MHIDRAAARLILVEKLGILVGARKNRLPGKSGVQPGGNTANDEVSLVVGGRRFV